MRAYVKGFIFSCILLVLFSTVIFIADTQGYFNLKNFEFKVSASNDLQTSSIAGLYKTSSMQGLQGLKGKSLLSISASAVQASLLEDEWIEAVNIRRVFPGSLRVEVQAKKWWAYLVEKNKYYPVTENGDLLASIPVLAGPDLPLIFMNKKKYQQHKKYIVDIFRKLNIEDIFSTKNLQEIGVDKQGVFFIIQPGRTHVRLGIENIDLRIARAEKVLSYLRDHHLQGRVIDANFTQKVVVKLRKAR